MTTHFLRGIVVGFSIAAPVGPIGVLCIRRTLAEGRMAGLFSGLGAATADAIYGCIAAFGLTAITRHLVEQQVWLGLIGGAFLCYLGVRTFMSCPSTATAATESRGWLRAYASTFILTLTNPMTMLSFAAMFAGLGLATTSADYLSASMLVLGVFVGSTAWWLLLSFGVGALRSRFDQKRLRWVNRISGAIIVVFGVVALISAFQGRD